MFRIFLVNAFLKQNDALVFIQQDLFSIITPCFGRKNVKVRIFFGMFKFKLPLKR